MSENSKINLSYLTLLIVAAPAALYCLSLASNRRVVAAHGTVGVFFDTSYTNRGRIGSEVVSYASISPRLPEGMREFLYRIDGCLARLPGDLPRASDEEFLSAVVPLLKAPSGLDNTYLNLAFTEGVSLARNAEGKVILVYCSDWYLDGMTPAQHEELRDAARELAKNEKVVLVVVLGVAPANDQRARSDLAPLGKKLRFPSLESGGLSIVEEALG